MVSAGKRDELCEVRELCDHHSFSMHEEPVNLCETLVSCWMSFSMVHAARKSLWKGSILNRRCSFALPKITHPFICPNGVLRVKTWLEGMLYWVYNGVWSFLHCWLCVCSNLLIAWSTKLHFSGEFCTSSLLSHSSNKNFVITSLQHMNFHDNFRTTSPKSCHCMLSWHHSCKMACFPDTWLWCGGSAKCKNLLIFLPDHLEEIWHYQPFQVNYFKV